MLFVIVVRSGQYVVALPKTLIQGKFRKDFLSNKKSSSYKGLVLFSRFVRQLYLIVGRYRF